MSQRFFITGTDTGIGKTTIACGLLQAFRARGYSTLALKPVASGGLEDIQKLKTYVTLDLPAAMLNPVMLKLPIAPHIAASQEGVTLTADSIVNACQPALKQRADITLIEGAGGWWVPINPHETLADVAKALAANIILVVGMRLGCLNHALLTQQAIRASGCELVGWVANCIDPEMPFLQENIHTLRQQIMAPLLGVVPYSKNPADYLEIERLMVATHQELSFMQFAL